jgi:hypothetical protein
MRYVSVAIWCKNTMTRFNKGDHHRGCPHEGLDVGICVHCVCLFFRSSYKVMSLRCLECNEIQCLLDCAIAIGCSAISDEKKSGTSSTLCLAVTLLQSSQNSNHIYIDDKSVLYSLTVGSNNLQITTWLKILLHFPWMLSQSHCARIHHQQLRTTLPRIHRHLTRDQLRSHGQANILSSDLAQMGRSSPFSIER